jgi:thymidine kinase
MSKIGSFTFIVGPMYSGKTEELIRIASRYKIAKKNIKSFKPKLDTRHGKDVIVSHNQKALAAKDIVNFEDIFPTIHNHSMDIDAIFVDEIQFVKRISVSQLLYLTDELGIDVFCSGLLLDSFRNKFEGACRILPYATEVRMLKSVCSTCGDFNATYTHRKNESNVSGEQVLIGDSSIYSALCPKCFHKACNSDETVL